MAIQKLRSRNGHLIRTPAGKLAICHVNPCAAWTNPPVGGDSHKPTVLCASTPPAWSICGATRTEQEICANFCNMFGDTGDFTFVPGVNGPTNGLPAGTYCIFNWTKTYAGITGSLQIACSEGGAGLWYARIYVETGGAPLPNITGIGQSASGAFLATPLFGLLPPGTISVVGGKLSCPAGFSMGYGETGWGFMCGRGHVVCSAGGSVGPEDLPQAGNPHVHVWTTHIDIVPGTFTGYQKFGGYSSAIADDGSNNITGPAVDASSTHLIDYDTGEIDFVNSDGVPIDLVRCSYDYYTDEAFDQFPFVVDVSVAQT